MGRENESLSRWSRLHDQDGRHAHMVKHSEIFSSRSQSPRILKLGMLHLELMFYNQRVNEFTMTGNTARSNLRLSGEKRYMH